MHFLPMVSRPLHCLHAMAGRKRLRSSTAMAPTLRTPIVNRPGGVMNSSCWPALLVLCAVSPEMPQPTDAQLEIDVEQALLSDPRTEHFIFHISVTEGVATLRGIVD